MSDTLGWDTARDQARLERELSAWSLSARTEPRPGVVWTFTSKGVQFNDIFVRQSIEDRFDRMRIGVQNAGAEVSFAVKVLDANGAEWTVKPVRLEAKNPRRIIEYSISDFHVARWSKDADGRLDFPLAFLALIAFEVQPGENYELVFDSIELEHDPVPQLEVVKAACPKRLRAGEAFDAEFRFRLIRGAFAEEGMCLELRRDAFDRLALEAEVDGSVLSWQPGEERTLSVKGARLGRFTRGGGRRFGVRIGGRTAAVYRKGRPYEMPEVRIVPRKAGRTVAEVKLHRGAPTLFINGVPHTGMAYAAYGPSLAVFRDFAQAGVDLFTIAGTPSESGYGLSRTAWVDPDTFDFSQLDERVGMILEANPDAYIFPRLYLHAPKWWAEKHPDELVTFDPGDGKPVPFVHHGNKRAPCWASVPWREDTAFALRKLIEHVQTSPYSDRIIGYHISSGTTEEWMQWGSNENQWVDYSPANAKAFRKWLRVKYGTDAALRKAWNDPAATLDAAQVPTKAQRMSCRLGTLRDPSCEQPSIDYYLYDSQMTAETIRHFAKVVKEATNREKIVGVFYGYVLQLAGEQRQQNAAHLALRKVWDCPDVDFMTSPTSYAFRQIGTGTSHIMSLLGGVMRAGKLWFDENDYRTSLAPGNVGQWGKPPDIAGDKLVQDRELAAVLTRGYAQWWFDVGRNRYDDPELMKRIGKLVGHAHGIMDADRTPVDEIAFVIDSRSLAYMEVGNVLSRTLIMQQIPQAARMGAPVAWYDLSDLKSLPPRKMYVFVNCFAPKDEDVDRMRALMSDGRMLVFVYAPGVFRGGAFDPAASERLIGFPLAHKATEIPLRVSFASKAPLLEGVKQKDYGADCAIRGWLAPGGSVGEVLGTLTDGSPGLTANEKGGCTIVYSAAPCLPCGLLRNLAKKAGVHLYIETPDVVWASKELLSVSVNEAGSRRIVLPGKRRVYDVYAGETISENADAFTADFESGQTRMWRLDAPK